MHSFGRWVAGFCAYFFASGIFASSSDLNMPYGVTPISNQIYNLHMAAFWICCIIGLVTFSVLFFSIFKYRKSKGANAAHFHEHLGIEILWTVIPTLILIGLAIPATLVLKNIHNTDASQLTIKVIGYQWRWKYEYLDQGISYFSTMSTPQSQINNQAAKDPWFLLEVDNPVVVPVNTKVKILVTSDDVIHAWWVPDLGVKQDAIPGYINENWFYITKPGTYRGQCGELCGVNHAFMPIVVKAVSKDEFNSWVVAHSPSAAQAAKVSSTPLTKSELLSLGVQTYSTNCAMCHQSNGLGLSPNFPALKNAPKTTGPVDQTIETVMHGVPGTAMQGFADKLDAQSLAAVITYVRNAWGNDAVNAKNNLPTLVQPKEINAKK